MKIKLCGLCKRYGTEDVLDSIETELEPGKLVSLVGSNGAGKSTLMKLLSTLHAPTSGHILFDGEILQRDRIDLRAKLYYLEDSPFFLSDSPIDHICLSAALFNRPLDGLKQNIIEWLRQFDLLDMAEKPISTMSRGQRYKVAFIALLAANPELWLLDEPFAAGVDPTGISAIKRNLNKVVGAGATVIYSTQIVELAESFSDQVWVLHKGRLKIDMQTKELDGVTETYGLAGVFEQLRASK